MRGFSRSQSCRRVPPARSAAATATSTSMSCSASARWSSKRHGAAFSRPTTARPPARPSGLQETSNRCKLGQCCSAWHSSAQPRGPIELARSEMLSNRSAFGPRNPPASPSAPASVSRLFERSKRTKNGRGPSNTFLNTPISASPSREAKVLGWLPGASMKNVPDPASQDSNNDCITRWLTLQPADSAALLYILANPPSAK
mmetsp:Transcript_130758/g.364400  ORF Transcript_130758/g.364400 Transcript_130758/m.364400 type:complete len:201 (-) Transcript_130758:195-797(-)